NQLIYEPNSGNNYDFPCFDQPPQYHIDPSPPQDLDSHSHCMLLARENNRILEEILSTHMPNSPVVQKEPGGSDDFTEITLDEEQCLWDEIISTIPAREIDEFIKSSYDDLVLILKESELTLDSTDLECSMPIDPPLPFIDVLGDAKVDIDLPFIEHLDTLSTGDREIDFNPIKDIEELERLLDDDPVPVPKVFDAPLGNSDSVPRSYDVTFSNPLFDFNDDYTLCYDNTLFDEELKDISSLDPPESTLVIDESTLLVTPLPDSKEISLREAEKFDPFFSLTQSGGTTRVMETSSLGFHHMPSPRHAAYSPKEVMYCFYHPHHTPGDGFDHECESKIPLDRQLLERRLLRSLEKFVGGREYGEGLRLL
ncbi:hypothetical protein Tco_0898030, partial [Tanacetum coccineum]